MYTDRQLLEQVAINQLFVVNLLNQLGTQMTALDTAVAQLQAEVTAETAVEQSAITLINGIAAQIAAAIAAAQGDDTQAVANVQAAVASMQSSSQGLAAAVASQTAPPPATITVSPTSFTGTVGQPFTGAVTASGGVAPYTYTATLPAGLSMDAGGNITGTYATGSGSVTATDSTTPTPLSSGPVSLTFA